MLPLVQVTMELVVPPLVVPPLVVPPLVKSALMSLTSLLLQGCRRRKNQTVVVGPMLLPMGPPLVR